MTYLFKTCAVFDSGEKQYYPGGMIMPGRIFNSNSYRYGYQSSEKDDEITGVSGANHTTLYRELDTRLLRWWSPDPVFKPSKSSYQIMSNNPIFWIDPQGDDEWTINDDGDAELISKDGDGVFIDGLDIAEFDFTEQPDVLTSMATYCYKNWSVESVDNVFPALSKDIVNNGVERFVEYYSELGSDYFYDHIGIIDINYEGHGPAKTYLADKFPGVEWALHIVAWRDNILRPFHGGTEEGNALEHKVGVFLLESKYGTTGLIVANGNEIYNIYQDYSRGGMSQVLDGLTGVGDTAFEWSDYWNNAKGTFRYLKHKLFNK